MRQTLLVGSLVLASVLGVGCSATDTRQSTGEYADSALTTSKVKALLAAQDVGSLLDVEVETFRDVVQLSGFVDTQADKDRAGEVASSVEGVSSVDNSIIVKPAG